MPSATTGGVRILLRAEGFCVFLVALLAFSNTHFGWGTFAIYILVPDLSFLGYLAGRKIGAVSYNVAHSYIGATLCLAAGLYSEHAGLLCASTIWFAHIGVDRSLGYGLKYFEGFSFTHLGVIGRMKHIEQSSSK